MLLLPPRRLACALALSLLCLTPLARAQTPTVKPSAPQVLFRVEYAMVNADEANGLAPVKPSIKAEVQCFEGKSVDKIYHRLIRTQGSLSQCPPVLASSNGDAYFPINTNPFGNLAPLLPPDSFSTRIEASLLVASRINQNGTIRVTFNALAGVKDTTIAYWPRLPVTRTVRSGERLLLISLPIQQSDSTTAYKAFMFVIATVVKSKTVEKTP